ncbi:MAG TPA: tubulin-like doman-containing protein, partial [Longimicrobium sp.]|nr:tubulin-like doman-containing protein [Longimicrobium sp.]
MAIKNASDIEPTLFLGLGGAGGKVLGRLRRIYDQEFGRAGAVDSPVQFLLLDADDFDKLDEAVKGSLSERDEFLPISHFNPRHYIDQHRRDPHSDLRRWFDRNTRPLLEDAFIRDGASRLRMLGRLCLHRSYYEVQKALAEKINRARSARALVEGGGTVHRSERPIRVILVSSSCGGTGSGIFLDIVYLINRLIRDAGATPDVISFLFLPFWFIDANRAIDTELVPYFQANAWAFFEELNYVLLHPERLADIALDPGRREGVAPGLQGQDYEPLKTVFLVDSVIPNVGRFQDANDWNDYIAQSIFHVFLAP